MRLGQKVKLLNLDKVETSHVSDTKLQAAKTCIGSIFTITYISSCKKNITIENDDVRIGGLPPTCVTNYKPTKFINLTPHDINIAGFTIPVNNEKQIVRIKETIIETETGGLIDILDVDFQEVIGLPEPEEDIMYIVSLPTALALRGKRHDVAAPGDPVRNASGQMVGCLNLKRVL